MRLYTARTLARRERDQTTDRFVTAVDALDTLLEGGLRRGATVELIGRLSSGRFSLVLSVLAAVTRTGQAAALVDLGDGFDPQAAVAAGVDLERVLWARPRSVREALASAEAILGCGMPLLVVDLGLPPLPGGRGAEAAWLRLARAARAQDTALLVASPYRATGTAAQVVLHAQGRRAVWQPKPGAYRAGPTLLHGLAARLDVHKRRGGRPGAHARYAFAVDEAVRHDDGEVPVTAWATSCETARPIAPVVALRRRASRG